MRFCSLGSGSGGNATVVEARDGSTSTRLLIDCGFSLRELKRRLGRACLGVDDLDGVFLTHEHGDHVGCAVALARRHGVPLWMSAGTWQAIGAPDLGPLLHVAQDGAMLSIGDLAVLPFAVPHDAAEPLQLRLSDGARRLGVLTDAGSTPPSLGALLAGCDAVLIECNHDTELLGLCGYPAFLQRRIGGALGHLSNRLAAELLARCMHGALRHVVAAHLSVRSNRPALARAALAMACGGAPDDIVVADGTSGFDWLSLD
jgi:phosphoribosyl 1,2-cyclic phosphodiesterase